MKFWHTALITVGWMLLVVVAAVGGVFGWSKATTVAYPVIWLKFSDVFLHLYDNFPAWAPKIIYGLLLLAYFVAAITYSSQEGGTDEEKKQRHKFANIMVWIAVSSSVLAWVYHYHIS